tara:strand:+ start:562 stop:3228 length:2667 start_codon:yes stop_codon:yes gene_type:complete
MFNKTKMVWRIFFVRSSFKRVRFLSVIALSLIFSCFTVAAETDDKRYRIQIEAGTADRSLIELAAQTDRTLVYSFDDTKDIVVRQLAGRFTLVEGLQKLLAGTELAFSIERNGAIRVIRNSKSGVIDNMKKNNTRLGWFGGLLAILATASAHTEEVQVESDKVRTIEEVIVTATRRETSARETPISISAFNDETLGKQGIESFEGIVRQTPGVTFTGANSFGRFVVRGIQTSATNSSNGEQRQVAVYYDDVPVSSFSVVTPNLRLFDTERVEVLRGPQGTSFGSGALSGAVRVVTKKADSSDFDAAVRVDYSSIDEGGTRKRLSGMINVPITDQFAVRAVIYDRDEDGFIDNVGSFGAPVINDENGAEEQGYRFSSVWEPSDTVKVTLAHSFDEQSVGSLAGTQNFDSGAGQRATFFSESLDVELDITSVKLEYDLGWAVATHTTSVSSQLTAWDLDLDALFGPALPFGYGETIDSDTTIHELRLVSAGDSSLSWLAGLYSFDLDAKASGASFVGAGMLGLYGVDASAIPKERAPGVTNATVNRGTTNEENALYGELLWSLSDALTLKVGARYTQYNFTNKDNENYASDVIPLAFSGGGVASTSPVLGSVYTTGDKSNSIINASLQWNVNDQAMLYASASEGFRRSHPNFVQVSSVDPTDSSFIPAIADADTLWNYELGYKALALEDRLSLNVAVYMIEWSGAQVSASRQSDAAPYTTNAGDIEAYGVELDMLYLISDSLEMGGSVSLSNSEITSIDERSALASGLVKGASLVGSDTQMSAFAEYRIWTQGDASINTRFDAQYFSGYNNGPQNLPGVGVPNPRFKSTDAITNINIQIGYENRHWGLYLYAENVASNDDRVWDNPDPFSNNNVVTLNPRTIGLRLDYRL